MSKKDHFTKILVDDIFTEKSYNEKKTTVEDPNSQKDNLFSM